MDTDTAGNSPKVTLDTNILISALVYGGKPELVLRLIVEKKVNGVTSLILLAELLDTLINKFRFEFLRIQQIERLIKKHFHFVYPKKVLDVVRDEDDNRVLEAALEGRCDFVITGDQDLLELRNYKKIKILTAEEFLQSLQP